MILTPSFRTRSGRREILDLETRPAPEMRRIFRLIGYVNRFLGGEKVVLGHLERFSAGWRPGTLIRILDVGTGDAGIPRAIVKWARRRGHRVQVTGLDLSSELLEVAREDLGGRYPEINFIRGSAYSLPAAPRAFDYVTASMFFHHLPDDHIPDILREFDRAVARGIIVNDLLRRRRAYWGILLAGILAGDPVFRNDAPLSVLRGFRMEEAEALVRRSGLDYLGVAAHYAHRFSIAGEKHAAL